MKRLAFLGVLLVSVVFAGTVDAAVPDAVKQDLLEKGKKVYFKRCVWCHGIEGAGDGPSAQRHSGPAAAGIADIDVARTVGPVPDGSRPAYLLATDELALAGVGAGRVLSLVDDGALHRQVDRKGCVILSQSSTIYDVPH